MMQRVCDEMLVVSLGLGGLRDGPMGLGLRAE